MTVAGGPLFRMGHLESGPDFYKGAATRTQALGAGAWVRAGHAGHRPRGWGVQYKSSSAPHANTSTIEI